MEKTKNVITVDMGGFNAHISNEEYFLKHFKELSYGDYFFYYLHNGWKKCIKTNELGEKPDPICNAKTADGRGFFYLAENTIIRAL